MTQSVVLGDITVKTVSVVDVKLIRRVRAVALNTHKSIKSEAENSP